MLKSKAKKKNLLKHIKKNPQQNNCKEIILHGFQFFDIILFYITPVAIHLRKGASYNKVSDYDDRLTPILHGKKEKVTSDEAEGLVYKQTECLFQALSTKLW